VCTDFGKCLSIKAALVGTGDGKGRREKGKKASRVAASSTGKGTSQEIY